jgi:hypothetical protein
VKIRALKNRKPKPASRPAVERSQAPMESTARFVFALAEAGKNE